MKSVKFPEVNIHLAENQPEYETLYVHLDKNDPQFPMTACFELTDEQIKEIVETRKIWFTQLTFGGSFQPINLSTQNPFSESVAMPCPIIELTDINVASMTGKYLYAALAKLSTESQKDKTPVEILAQLEELQQEMFNK